MARKKKELEICVLDFETDPFRYGRMPEPFACGVAFESGEYIDFWGDDCVDQMIRHFNGREKPCLIYAHNGGKFDFFFFLDYLGGKTRIINGRVAQADFGKHVVRDSYCALPIPLSAYKKDEIDYDLFERDVREANKSDILLYQRHDCEYTLKLILKFRSNFGDKLTIGSAAISSLKEFHDFSIIGEIQDSDFRDYYYGGRVQCFEKGILIDDWKVYDVNSSYPDTMQRLSHPISGRYVEVTGKFKIGADGWVNRFKNQPYMCDCEIVLSDDLRVGLPLRCKVDGVGKLTFEARAGRFKACSHELQWLVANGYCKIVHIHRLIIFQDVSNFKEFVDYWVEEKIRCETEGDDEGRTIAKLVLNSAYGKFASNPENYFDWVLLRLGEDPPDRFLEPQVVGDSVFWKKPSEKKRYLNVATAAFITSGARLTLMKALVRSERPAYCDTDSIICRDMEGVEIHDTKLGAWKCEAWGSELAVAGKKMYSLTNGDAPVNKKGAMWKKASKGGVLSASEVRRVAMGECVEWESMAPSYRIGMVVDPTAPEKNFTKRKIRAT